MQDLQNINNKNTRERLIFREIFNKRITSGGILPEDQEFYRNQTMDKLLKNYPFEENGINSSSMTTGMKKLQNIIYYLADNTKPISVDTMYYLADQREYTNIIQLAEYLINTDNVDVAGANYEYWNFNIPTETLLARCIRNRNWIMINLLLTNEKSLKKIKPTINRIVKNVDKNEINTIVSSTDLDFLYSDLFELYTGIARQNKINCNNELIELQNWTKRLLFLFYKAGADFSIKDNKGKSTLDYMKKTLSTIFEGSIPDELKKIIE